MQSGRQTFVATGRGLNAGDITMSASSDTRAARRAEPRHPPEPTRPNSVVSVLGDSLRPRGPFLLELSEEVEGDRTLIRARGEVDVVTAPKLAGRLDTILRGDGRDVVVDLSGTEFLDSAGLHVLLNAQRRLTRRSRRLRVVCGPGPVRQVIELARLIETLGVNDPE